MTYVAILTRGHPSYKATISENTPCIIVFSICISLMGGLIRGGPFINVIPAILLVIGFLYYFSYDVQYYHHDMETCVGVNL